MLFPFEERILAAIREHGPLVAYGRLIEENNARIQGPDLDCGRELTTERTAIHTMMVREWAAEQQRALGYERPFAVAALGGTGRGEVTPCSDLDFALLFDDALEGNSFLLELQRQTLHTDEFEAAHGFACVALPFCLDDVPTLDGKQLNAFVDLSPVYDPNGIVPLFRERTRATFDPFAHFLHVRGFWKTEWEEAGAACELLEGFDIKNDGLRVFLAGIWTLAGQNFQHCHEIYRRLSDPRDLAAYEFLLRIRSWLHLRRPPGGHSDAFGNHAEDIMHFEDFAAFGEMLGPEADERAHFEFANGVRTRLLSARRRIMSFAQGVIEHVLRNGLRIAPRQPVILGAGGLYYDSPGLCATEVEKSSAALSLLLASQRYATSIDASELQTTFRGAGDWLVRVPELSALFYDRRGSLAGSFEFLSRLDGAMERLFPGYGQFEASLDARVRRERTVLRGALERKKELALEQFIASAAQPSLHAAGPPSFVGGSDEDRITHAISRLDADHLAAIKLALKTKRLPATAEDAAVRADANRPRHERFASGFSGIPLEEYYRPFLEEADFSPETVRLTEFLVRHRRAFKERAVAGINFESDVANFVALCGTEQALCALYVFYSADRAEWESAKAYPPRWFIIRELYDKALRTFHPTTADPSSSLRAAGYEEQELAILRDFGHDFFGGAYRAHAIKFGSHLVRLADRQNDAGPKAALVRDGTSVMVGVAARDRPGLAACITGALWKEEVDLSQAHLFSATNQGLALDFFHIATAEKRLPPTLFPAVEEAIREQRYIGPEDEGALPALHGEPALDEIRPGGFRLRLETDRDTTGLVYALTYKVFRHLGGSIHGLNAHATRRKTFISVYHSLPRGLSLEAAREIVARTF